MKRAAFFFSIEAICYVLITINFRAIADGLYGWAAITDIINSWLSFTLIRQIAGATTRVEQVGYALGGAAGTLLGIAVSDHAFRWLGL